MSTTDRTIISAAVFGMILSLAVGSALIPIINRERIDLQLTANESLVENLPPQYAIPYMALAAFRGAIINFMWIRLEDMKQEGKFWEAKQLSEIITKLQPRFPQVWANRAWNLSYNISVATHTERERWFWVRSGIELLRDEGIPHNPNAILLYKELSWIFLHKIGMFSDDLHRYYKTRLAEEWHYLLGEPPHGSTEDVIQNFRPIAEMYDRYINYKHMSLEARRLVRKLSKDVRLKELLDPLVELPAVRMEVRLERLHRRLAREDPEQARRLEPLLEDLQSQQLKARGNPVERFLAGEPDVRPLVQKLREVGLEPSVELMERVGRMRALVKSQAQSLLEDEGQKDETRVQTRLRELLGDPAFDELENQDTPEARLLNFMRALTLDQKYNMDPLWMLELMEGRWYVHPDELPQLEAEDRIPAVPIDWRHSGAHGLYWASLGVRKSQGLITVEDFDLLNIDRQMLHGLQAMMHNGRILYDPVSGPGGGYFRMLPDLRFVDAYHYAVFGSVWRNPAERLKGAAVVESFEAGHENFLIWAVQQLYFYGDQRRAERYYAMLRDLYSERFPDRATRFTKPLARFVMDEFRDAEEISDDDRMRGVINAWLMRAIDEGFAANDSVNARQRIDAAQQVYDAYQSSQDYRTLTGPDDINRMSLPPFDDMVTQALEIYMRPETPRPLDLKARVWRYFPDGYKRRIYDRVRPLLVAQADRIGVEVEVAFPEPVGMADFRDGRGQASGEEGGLFESRPRSGMR